VEDIDRCRGIDAVDAESVAAVIDFTDEVSGRCAAISSVSCTMRMSKCDVQ
jgi:hypothetical protein